MIVFFFFVLVCSTIGPFALLAHFMDGFVVESIVDATFFLGRFIKMIFSEKK